MSYSDDSKCEKDEDCKEPGYICEAGQCILGIALLSQKMINFWESLGCRDDGNCPDGFSCVSRKCRAAAGKVLLGSINIKTLSCTNCSSDNEGVLLELRGERLPQHTDGFPCQTIALNKENSQDFQRGEIVKFDGSTRDQQKMLGNCFEVGLQWWIQYLVLNYYL